MIILIIIAPIFHKFLKKVGCGCGEWPSVCDHLDVKEMSVSNNTLEQNLNSMYTGRYYQDSDR